MQVVDFPWQQFVNDVSSGREVRISATTLPQFFRVNSFDDEKNRVGLRRWARASGFRLLLAPIHPAEDEVVEGENTSTRRGERQ